MGPWDALCCQLWPALIPFHWQTVHLSFLLFQGVHNFDQKCFEKYGKIWGWVSAEQNYQFGVLHSCRIECEKLHWCCVTQHCNFSSESLGESRFTTGKVSTHLSKAFLLLGFQCGVGLGWWWPVCGVISLHKLWKSPLLLGVKLSLLPLKLLFCVSGAESKLQAATVFFILLSASPRAGAQATFQPASLLPAQCLFCAGASYHASTENLSNCSAKKKKNPGRLHEAWCIFFERLNVHKLLEDGSFPQLWLRAPCPLAHTMTFKFFCLCWLENGGDRWVLHLSVPCRPGRKSLSSTGGLFGVDFLSPAISSGNSSDSPRAGASIVAKSCLLSKPTQLWQLFSTTRTARNARAAHVCHFLSLSPLLLHNKQVSASSFQLFCQRAQTLCAMALTMDRAGCFCSSWPWRMDWLWVSLGLGFMMAGSLCWLFWTLSSSKTSWWKSAMMFLLIAG